MLKERGFCLALAISLTAGAALGQIDPEKRELVQFGFTQATEGASPVAAYGFYYLNEPGIFGTNTTLRLALAPVYLDSEVGLSGLLGKNTDLGIGLAGGGFADNYYEFQGGKYIPGESFNGDGAENSVSIYHLFDPGKLIPLYGFLRVREHVSTYQKNDDYPGFVLPHDHWTTAWRAGLRLGGREPLLSPDLAMEISGWYEGQYRTGAGAYGLNNDAVLESHAELFWGRALLIYTLPKTKQRIEFSVTGGSSTHADRFSAYRLGGDLPLASEFPLAIPGYFYQELSASSFVCLNARYSVPLDPGKHWSLTPIGSLAEVDSIYGLEQPRRTYSGVGMELGYRSGNGVWQAGLMYGYGIDARPNDRDGQSIGILCQINLEAHHPGGHSRLDQVMGYLPTHLW
ncbi:MAG: hypothetical protein ACLQVY_15070 [Limisphaerales bacterium]